MNLPHSRSTQCKYRLLVVCIGLALSAGPSLLQIQASPAAFHGIKDVKLDPGVVTPAWENQQARQLEPGRPIERELTGGQSHSYQVTLTADQYAKVVVEQRGIDVEMKLSGLDGKQITRCDSETWTRGQETVEWVAEEGGNYRLDVAANYKNSEAGRYEIQVAEIRVATENDRALFEARKINAEFLKLYSAGKYDEALPLAERELEIYERLLGSEHLYIARALNNRATIYHQKNDYVTAEPLYQRALTITEKIRGPEHPEVAKYLRNLALLYESEINYAKAEPFLQRALAISEKSLGPEHRVVAKTLFKLVLLYHELGDYAKAETFSRRLLTIEEKVGGPESLDVAFELNALASTLVDKGDYARAEPLFRRALTIYEKLIEPEELLVGQVLYNFATLYSKKGDYTRAMQLNERSLSITEKALGSEHPFVAYCLTNLALNYSDSGDYAKAERLHQRALTIREKALGPEHPEVAISLDNLANSYRKSGDYAKAESLFQRALAIQEKVFGSEHPHTAGFLDHLALLYRDRSDYTKAEQLNQRALTIREKVLGPEHPDVAKSLNTLASLNAAKGDIAQAITFQFRANAIEERNFTLNLTTGSERQKLVYLSMFSPWIDFRLLLHSQAAPTDPRALNLAFTTILQRKARGLDAMTDTIATLRRQITPEDQTLLDKLIDARSQLAALTLKEPDAAKPDTYRRRLEPLKEKVEKLEEELGARSADFRRQSQPVTLAAVQAALPTDSALVEYAYFTPIELNTEKKKPPRYLAYALATQGQPKWVDLGEAAAVDRTVDAWRKALRNPNRTDVKRLARAVDEKLMRPVRSLLGEMPGNIRLLLIAPEGSLNLIPFAALVDEQNRYLIERYSISYLTSGRDLLRLETSQPSKASPLVVANPDFGRLATIAMRGGWNSAKPRTRNQARSQIDPTQIFFQPLPATEDEALAIKALLPNASVLRREEATETALKQTSGPRFLHIATHGFFLDHQETPPTEGAPPRVVSSGTTVPAAAQATPYTVQLEATPALETAQDTVKRLRVQGVEAYIVKSRVKGKGTFFRVRVGKFPSLAEANKHGSDIREKGVAREFLVARYEPPQEDLIELSPTIPGATAKPANSTSTTTPPANSQPVTEPPSGLRLSKLAAQVKDPLLRSGLALAGANHGKSGDDDGVLTAMEAAYLDLSGTKLVVLSACDTGVGEVKNGEGVQGLRRALVLAGSESQVISLWPVSDEATKDLMIPYYKALQQGEGRGEGLRQVQLRMLRGRKDRRHPFYWAAFIQSGEWANLDGLR
jgi:CHAT domain-containing protein/lipopolysaccharide biosynthesis regulator YciM